MFGFYVMNLIIKLDNKDKITFIASILFVSEYLKRLLIKFNHF